MQATARRGAPHLPAVVAALLTALLLATVLGGTALGSAAAGAAAAPTDPVEPAPLVPVTPRDADRALGAPLVVIGIGGLGWDEVSAEATPTLWSLLSDGAAAGAVTVRTSGEPACAAGGWLSLSAGRGAASERFGGWCLSLPEVQADADADGGATVASWATLAAEQAESTYDPVLGTLGTALAGSGVCATAVGPGAALALADRSGRVARYFPSVGPDVFGCPLTLVDVGLTSALDGLGGGPLPVDARVAEVLSEVPADATVLVTSVATTLGARLTMGVALAAGPGVPAELLTTASTRRDGVLRLLDLPSTLVDTVGVEEPATFQGSPLLLGGSRDDPAATARSLAEISVADRGLRVAATPVLNLLGLASLILVIAALLVARRTRRTALRRAAEVAFLLLAALPLASYLVTLLRWWRFGDPGLALWLGMTVIAAVVAAAVLVLPRRPIWTVALGLSLLTSAVLVVDAVTGATLHWGSPLGTSPVLGNRYYGFGNSTYAVFAVHTIVLAGALAGRYVATGRRRLAVLAVVVVAAVAVVVDIWPTWGADVGGGLALVPAFGLLALGVGGQRVTAVRAALVLVGGVVVVAAVAWLDWLRPASERSHAGRFLQQVLDGDATDLLLRKLEYAVASLDRGVSAWLTLAGLLAVAATVLLPERFSPPALEAAVAAWPGLRATLGALLVSALLGALVNDWGIRVATVLLSAGLPLIAVVCLRATDQRPSPDRTVVRSSDSATPAKTARAIEPAASPPTSAPRKSALPNRSPTR